MTRRRWIADQVSETHAALLGEHARHLAQVLRAHIGQEFEISTGTDVRLGRICNIQPDRVEFDLGPSVGRDNGLPITIALSIFKFDRMEWAIEKCVELGVTRIIPVIAARTDSHLSAAAVKRSERWRKIAVQAVEQSRRTHLPQISAPAKLTEAVKSHSGTRVVLSEVEHTRTLKSAFVDHSTGSITLAIGPEGGWTSEELQSFVQAGWISASLGNTILRVETAAIAAAAIT